MKRVTFLTALLSAAASGILFGCGGEASGGAAGPPGHERGSDSTGVRAVIAAGYRERARLGLGSPFRLVDFALHDPRLDSLSRVRIGRAVLQEVARGNVYQVDPVALDAVVLEAAPPRLAAGIHHLELMEDAIARTRDPRAGAMALRLAYGLARLEGSIGDFAHAMAVQAIALARDREIARRDALRLLRASKAASTDPVLLIPEWRRRGYFQVEDPPLLPLSTTAEAAAVRMAPPLLERIRALLAVRSHPGREAGSGETHLGREAAARLLAVAEQTAMPPQSGVVMAVHLTGTAHRVDTHPVARRVWHFLRARATNEEQIVASAALTRGPHLRPAMARMLLLAAIELRPYAQEEPWFPGSGGPSPVAMAQRFGIIVNFAADVPPAWRPFYLGALERSLSDLESVLPALDLEGLRIHIPNESKIQGALASHAPRSRVLEWPTRTGPGSLAHELAHDLDWQAARRTSWKRAYASDVAVSSKAPLGRVLLELIPPRAELATGLTVRQIAHLRRPAEVLARNFEWFILTELARRRRSNGYLTSAQDALLTGHGSVQAPGGEEAGSAVLRVLSTLLPIPPAATERFAGEYGPRGMPDPYTILWRTSQARLQPAAGTRSSVLAAAPWLPLSALRQIRDRALAQVNAWLCQAPPFEMDAELAAAYSNFIAESAAARGRALVLAELRGSGTRAEESLALREFYGPTWPVADSLGALTPDLRALIAEVQALRRADERPGIAADPRIRSCSACAPGPDWHGVVAQRGRTTVRFGGADPARSCTGGDRAAWPTIPRSGPSTSASAP